jgi:hypothetical protein
MKTPYPWILAVLLIGVVTLFSCNKEEDKNPPVITLIGNSTVYVDKGTTYSDAGATALDDKDGDISAQIVVTNLVNTGIEDTYYVRYNVSDQAGNPATEVVRTVIVMIF